MLLKQKEQLKELVEKSVGTYRIYEFIMYTRSHSYIVKVLRDNDFWNELNEISGDKWSIFSVKPFNDGYYEYPRSNGNYMHMMIPIWHEPNDNRKCLDLFFLDESKDLPCFIAFILTDTDELAQVTWQLDNTSEDNAFKSIREVVKLITNTLEPILLQYNISVR